MKRVDRAGVAVLAIATASFGMFVGFAWLRLSGPPGTVPTIRLLAQRWGVILFVLALQALATFVFFKRPADRAARALFLGACGRLASAVWVFDPPVPAGIGDWGYQIANLGGWMLMWSAGLHFALLFPRPNPILERHRWIVPVVYAAPYPIHIAYSLGLRFGAAGALDSIDRLGGDVSVLEFVYLGLLLVALVQGYRAASDAISRRQVRWVVFGIAVSGAAYLTLGIVLPAALGTPPLDWNVLALFGLIVPLTFAIAILRYRLFDIDVIINRTLVYFLLTALVAGAYLFAAELLGALLQARGSLGVSLLGVGLVAVVVQPLRDRLQRVVNRLMYGERDEPYAVLSRLGQRLQAALAPDAVLSTLVESVAQSLKLPYAAISLGPGDEAGIAAAYGLPVAERYMFPLVFQGESIGQLIAGSRASGERFTPAEEHLLASIAHQAGPAVHAARLTADLQRSRVRLVAAREEERRRLRRDLHDGLGPILASQGLKLAAARHLLGGDTASVETLLDQMIAQNGASVAEIRRVVYDLRPPALDERGLVEAIRDHTAGLDAKVLAPWGLRVEVESLPADLPPLPAAVEVAAYRIALEALTNVARHSRAHGCAIRFRLESDERKTSLRVEVSDDGVGMPAPLRAGVGLRSMRERAEELGGRLTIEAVPGGGTRVLAELPLAGES